MAVSSARDIATPFVTDDPHVPDLVLLNAQMEGMVEGCRWLEGSAWI